MYLHVGNDMVIGFKDIIAIFDMENTTVSKITRKFLNTSQKEGFVVNVSQEMPKSFIIARENDITRVYISHISSPTLLKRLGEPFGSDEAN